MTAAPTTPKITITQLQRLPEHEAEVRPLDFKMIVRLYQYTKPYAAKRNLLFLLVIIRSIQLPCLPAMITYVITGPIASHDLTGAILGTAAFTLLAAITHLTFCYRQRLALELGESVIHDLRMEIFRHIQLLNMSFHQKTKIGRVISRMTSDADSVRQGIQDVLFMGLVQTGQMLVAAAFMLWYDKQLFLVLLAVAPVLYAINHYFRRKLSKVFRDIQESFSRVTSTLAESVSGIRVTQGFVRQDVNAGLFADLVEDHSKYNMAAARTTGAFLPLLEFNNQLFYAALLIAAGYLVFQPHLPDAHARHQADALVGFFMMSTTFFGPVQQLGQIYNWALTAMAGAERVFHLLDTKPDWTDPLDARPLPPIQGKVEFQNITFSYVPNQPVLHDVSFTAHPGQTIALVGHTGSGKTTIINLISKFYLPQQGRLLIDGHDITHAQTDSLHKQMGIVLQLNFLFSGTVMDNIRVGNPSATNQQVIDAARHLDVLDLIEALPEGFSTSVGERGGLISIGQRQLICFARALLADPKILILDEATSSVDAITEARIQKALSLLLKGRTSFVVAHRMSTIRQADVILVLDHGRIIERGTHDQLLTTGGTYAHLYRRFILAGTDDE